MFYSIESIHNIQSKSFSQLCSQHFCDNCAENERAVAFCRDCSAHLCDKCEEAHKRLKITRNHTVKPHENSPPDSQAESQTLQTTEPCSSWKAVEPPGPYRSIPFANYSYFCKSHAEECSYWCVTCTLPCCDSCIKEPDHHANHEIQKREGAKNDIFLEDSTIPKNKKTNNFILTESKSKKNEIQKWFEKEQTNSKISLNKIDEAIRKVEHHAKEHVHNLP